MCIFGSEEVLNNEVLRALHEIYKITPRSPKQDVLYLVQCANGDDEGMQLDELDGKTFLKYVKTASDNMPQQANAEAVARDEQIDVQDSPAARNSPAASEDPATQKIE